MKKFLYVLLLSLATTNVAQETRVTSFGNDQIILTKSGVLEFQKERKYRGYLLKITNNASKLAVGYKGGVQVWDTQTGKFLLCQGLEGKTYNEIALSSNAEFLVGYREKKIHVWETTTCNVVTILEVDEYLNSFSLAISSNGEYVFYSRNGSGFRTSQKREIAELWNIKRNVKVTDLSPASVSLLNDSYDPFFDRGVLWPTRADFSTDSKTLVVQNSYRIYLFDVETGKLVDRLVDPSLDHRISQGGIYEATFNNDASLIVSRGADGLVKFWNLQKRELKQQFDVKDRVHGRASISKDNKYLVASGSKGRVGLWEISTGKMLWKGAEKNYFPSFSDPDVGLVSVENGNIYDIRSGALIQGVKGEFVADGKLIVSEKDGNMSVWNVRRN